MTDSAMGITYIFKAAQLADVTSLDAVIVGLLNYLVFLLLNVTLAIMTVTRAINQRGEIRDATGAGRLYGPAVTVLTEPCALYTANLILFIGTWWTRTEASHILHPILTNTQVRAFFCVSLTHLE